MKWLQVLQAVKAVVESALPSADVKALEENDPKPDRVGPGGTVTLRPGQPEVDSEDLSPHRYNLVHTIPLEIAPYESASKPPAEVLAEMMAAIVAGIAADRTLGGLCDYAECQPPTLDDLGALGAPATFWAELPIVAEYSTDDQLS